MDPNIFQNQGLLLAGGNLQNVVAEMNRFATLANAAARYPQMAEVVQLRPRDVRGHEEYTRSAREQPIPPGVEDSSYNAHDRGRDRDREQRDRRSRDDRDRGR